MLWLLIFVFLTSSDVLEFYSSKHLAATAFDEKGKANTAIILALYDSSNLKCKRLLKKPRMQFEDRWLADNFLITATHDYGKEGSDLSETFKVGEQCPTVVYIPKESEVKTAKDGELKGVRTWDGKGELNPWVREQIKVEARIVNESEGDVVLYWYQGQYKMKLTVIKPQRLITISVFISQLYVAHKAGPDDDNPGDVIYRFFATGESKVHVLNEYFCDTEPKLCKGSDQKFRKIMKKKWNKEKAKRLEIHQNFELMWSQPLALNPIMGEKGYEIFTMETKLRERLAQTIQRIDLGNLESKNGAFQSTIDKKDLGLRGVDQVMKEWVPQVKLKRKESEFFYFLEKANIQRHIRDAKKDILSVLIPILVQENDSKIYLSFQMPPSRKIDKVFLPTDASCVYESGRMISQMDSESSTAFIIVRYDLFV